ncbi:hypothetical protein GCM10010271_20660 [Streptomyces kurssanovii]|nr:hypothetical protein GCM10010271_20660 [Streptomyces kurssanovii]
MCSVGSGECAYRPVTWLFDHVPQPVARAAPRPPTVAHALMALVMAVTMAVTMGMTMGMTMASADRLP